MRHIILLGIFIIIVTITLIVSMYWSEMVIRKNKAKLIGEEDKNKEINA